MVDAVDVILYLHHDAAVLRHHAWSIWVIEKSLGGFERDGAVLSTTGVDLECVLVGEDFQLDARPGGAQACHGETGAPVVGSGTGGDEAGVCMS